MGTIGPVIHRAPFLICIVLVVVFPIVISTNTDKDQHTNTYTRKTEDSAVISKSSKESKLPSRDEENESMTKNNEGHRDPQSGKINDNSAALNRFLENVLKSRNDFKWIDEAVRNVNREKDWGKSLSEPSHLDGISSPVSSLRSNKLREKRDSDQAFETMWTAYRAKHEHENPSKHPQRVFLDRDMTFKRNANFDDPDTPQNSVNEKEAPSPLRNKGTMDDQVPKDWTRTEDICSLSDWLNSNKEPETEEEKRGDRWIRDHEAGQRNQLNPSNSDKDAGERYNVRSLRDETKKEDSPSLETLEETVLELKKNLDEGEKKVHDDSKTADSGRVKDEPKERRARERNKHERNEDDYEPVDSRWWETSGPDVFDVKKNEPSPGDLDDKNAQPKVWRTKRTEVNNEDGNPKLFHRAGFGEPYLEEKTLKELHDRKRRSKGTPSDEKRYLNEVRDKNNVQHGEKNSMITLEEPNYNNAANDLQEGTLSNNVDDVSKKIPNGWNVDGNRDAKENDEQSESSRGKPNETEKKLTKYEEKGENLEGDSLGTFGIATNELQPVSTETFVSTDGKEEAADTRMQKTEEQQENVGTSKGEQVIKVSEPQGRLYENSERTKEVQRIEGDDEERGKLSQQLSEGKRSAKGESGNINILLKSEKKNLIKINNENSLGNEQRPFVVNRFDVKKKLVVENEEKPGKSVSMIFKVKVEKKDSEERVNVGTRDSRFDADVFDLGKNKPNEEPYKDAVGFTNDLKQRNVDEERLKNSAEFDKGPAQRNEGPRNWYEGVAGDQTNLEQGAPKKCKEERDKFRNEEERFRDDKKKGESNDGAGSKDASASILDDNLKDSQGDNRKKYKEVFILTDGVGERKMNDKYVQRRILQYMEYSNDDVEDADSNYSDREEEEENRQDGAAESGVPRQRKQRSPQTGRANPVKAKLNVLIKEKLDKKKKSERRYKRKRRNPVDIIQYYDYDNDVQEQDGDPLSAVSEEERAGNNYEQNNPDESNAVIAESDGGTVICLPPAQKNDEHEKEMLKQERLKEKMKNKEPKEQFISIGKTSSKNATEMAGKQSDAASSSKLEFAEEDGSSGRLNEEKFPSSGARETMADPANCIQNADKSSKPVSSDDSIDGVRFADGKNDEPLYDELKKLYDWRDDESKSKPRIKGDQRMYHEANDERESFKDHSESPDSKNPSPNLLPLLLVHGDPGNAEIVEKASSIVSSERAVGLCAGNVSQSNYVALKSTDDMFKGGPEQSNSTEAKLRGPSAIGTTGECTGQKVNGARNDAASWSLPGQRQYIDTDSRSPYENRKYLAPRSGRERVQNIDREKQTVISSRDLHESFVEPLDWIDDFDKDIRVRLSRGLKTVENMRSNSPTNAILEKNLDLMATATSSETGNVRAKRTVDSRYETFNDDTNELNSERMDYDRRSKKTEPMDDRVRFWNSYEDKLPDADTEVEEYGSPEDDEDHEDYAKISRSVKSKKNDKRNKTLKKQKRKGHANKSSNRKRRHHKKHSSETGTKKKHKKRTSKPGNRHGNVKKSKIPRDEGKAHRRESSVKKVKSRREETDTGDTMTRDDDSQRKRFSLLLAADDVEDESQMDSALHGELAGKIVERVFEQVQKNEDLKVSLGPGLYQRHKTDDAVTANKRYRQSLNDDDMKHTEELLRKVMLLLNRLVFDEVQKKTCVSLPPDLTEFLDWILNVNPQESSLEQIPSLPLVHENESTDHFPRDKFLFQAFPDLGTKGEIDELRKKLRLMESLIREYNALSETERTKVRSVHDYMAKQLDMLLEYIETKKEDGKKGKSSTSIGAAVVKPGRIFHYQTGIKNATNGSYLTGSDLGFSPLTNVPNMLNFGNASLFGDGEYFSDNSIDFRRKGRRVARSADKRPKQRENRVQRKKRKKKHRKRYKGAGAIDQLQSKDSVHGVTASRRKRGYLDKDYWDSFVAGYEEPLIFTSMDINVEPDESREIKERSRNENTEKTRYWKDALAKGIDENYSNERNVDLSTSNNSMRKRKTSKTTESSSTSTSQSPFVEREEPITGENRVEDEVILLNKRQSWKKENEEQLEEVAFGEDMRKGSKDKELFEKLIEIDKEKSTSKSTARSKRKDENNVSPISSNTPRENDSKDCVACDRSHNYGLSNEDKLRMLERKINVYSDRDQPVRYATCS